MNNTALERPALGHIADLGSLYDARSDTFIPGISLFQANTPPEAIRSTQIPLTTLKFTKTESYKEKFDYFKMTPELTASFLGGLFSVEGSARYLTLEKQLDHVIQSSMYYSMSTVYETLNLTSPSLRDHIALHVVGGDLATHAVIGIKWGAQCIVTAKHELSTMEERKEVERDLDLRFNLLQRNIGPARGMHSKETETEDRRFKFDIAVHGDILIDDIKPFDFSTVDTLISDIPGKMRHINGGKGKPLTYVLMPLTFLSMFDLFRLDGEIILHDLETTCLDKFALLFDKIDKVALALQEYSTKIHGHTACVPQAHIEEIDIALHDIESSNSRFRSDYGNLLKAVRRGDADAAELHQLYDNHDKSSHTPKAIASLLQYEPQMDLMDSCLSTGVQYFGYGRSVEEALLGNPFDDVYIYYFSNPKPNADTTSHLNNLRLLFSVARNSEQKFVALVDCDALERKTRTPCIFYWRNANLITKDYLEYTSNLESNCLMQYDSSFIQKGMRSRPTERRRVEIPCPNIRCGTEACTWFCSRCQTIVEYGYVDDLIYCECGRCHYQHWKFQCKGILHGSGWSCYDPIDLHQYLRALDDFKELNILLLGQTGAGKSTWINAFLNYITYQNLDEAIASGNLKWTIPFQFYEQIEDENGQFSQHHIRYEDFRGDTGSTNVATSTSHPHENEPAPGSANAHQESSKSDKSGKLVSRVGESDTQETNVYSFYDRSGTRIRLIDTPGIGDTRGPEKDDENVRDVLNVLRSYKKLHGVLILLKANENRINTSFKFCFNQLLVHLHQSAKDNIAFGFTYSRTSGYKPGDTMASLQSMLERLKRTKISLSRQNIYCFDSESFRYLAAVNWGIDPGGYEDYAKSWEKSWEACNRLIKHFEGLTAHEVRSTTSLNEIRSIILRLQEPMTRLVQEMQKTINVTKHEEENIRKNNHTKEKLLQKRDSPKSTLISVRTDDPYTVCRHPNCIEYITSPTDKDEKVIHYKTVCHKPCYLKDVEPETPGATALSWCKATSCILWSGTCKCGHKNKDHLHIQHEYRKQVERISAQDAQRLNSGEFDTSKSLSESIIKEKQDLIKELQLELGQFEDALAQFASYLDKYSFALYNDVTLNWYEEHISNEKLLSEECGKETSRLANLLRLRDSYTKRTTALKDTIERGKRKPINETDIQSTIEGLYGLKFYGKDLKALVDNDQRIADECHREYNVTIPEIEKATSKQKASPTQRQYFPWQMGLSTAAASSSAIVAQAMTGSDDHMAFPNSPDAAGEPLGEKYGSSVTAREELTNILHRSTTGVLGVGSAVGHFRFKPLRNLLETMELSTGFKM